MRLNSTCVHFCFATNRTFIINFFCHKSHPIIAMKTQLSHRIGMNRLLLLGFCASILSSCYTARVYAPHPQVIPGFTEKGQGQLSVHSVNNSDNNGNAHSNEMTGVSVQAAYAPLKHVGLTLNYTRLKENDQFRQFEFASGYFGALSEKIILEAYGGFGTGSMRSGNDFSFGVSDEDNDPYTYDYRDVFSYAYGDMDTKRWFIQPSITVKPVKNMAFAFGLKYSRVDFYNLRIEMGEAPREGYDDHVEDVRDQIARAEMIEKHGAYTMIEPSITLRFGTEQFKGQLQIGFTSTGDKTLRDVIYHSYSSVGLMYSFPRKKKKS